MSRSLTVPNYFYDGLWTFYLHSSFSTSSLVIYANTDWKVAEQQSCHYKLYLGESPAKGCHWPNEVCAAHVEMWLPFCPLYRSDLIISFCMAAEEAKPLTKSPGSLHSLQNSWGKAENENNRRKSHKPNRHAETPPTFSAIAECITCFCTFAAIALKNDAL